jgi:hypothetical protein
MSGSMPSSPYAVSDSGTRKIVASPSPVPSAPMSGSMPSSPYAVGDTGTSKIVAAPKVIPTGTMSGSMPSSPYAVSDAGNSKVIAIPKAIPSIAMSGATPSSPYSVSDSGTGKSIAGPYALPNGTIGAASPSRPCPVCDCGQGKLIVGMPMPSTPTAGMPTAGLPTVGMPTAGAPMPGAERIVAGGPPCQCTPDQMSGGVIIRDPASPAPANGQLGPVVVEQHRSTVFDKIQSWFKPHPASQDAQPSVLPNATDSKVAGATTAKDTKTVTATPPAPPPAAPAKTDKVVSLPDAPKRQETPLAISTPPTSAKPSQTDVVKAPSKADLLKGWSKATSGIVPPTPGKAFPPADAPDPISPGGPPPANVAVTKSGDATYPIAVAKPLAKGDILTAPERFNPADTKLKAKGLALQTKPGTTGGALKAESAGTTPIAKGVVGKQDVGIRTVSGSGAVGMPPGAQSVLAARSGLDGPIAFVPVQPVVVPTPWRPPVPPAPQLPEPPQLNAFVNAFSPPNAPRNKDAAPAAGMGPQSMNGYGPMPPYAMMPGYGPPMNPAMMAGMPWQGGMNPYAQPPYAMMNPYVAPQAMPYGYYPPPAEVAMMQQQMAAAYSARQYQGPLPPPNPFAAPPPPAMVQPVSYVQPSAYVPPQPPPAPAAQPSQPAQAPAAQLGQLLTLLHDSPYPAQRELAANYLAACDWRANPQIAEGLLEAAKQDPAPTVRAGCIANLMRMNVANEEYRRLLHELRTDADPRVREAVEQALGRLGQQQAAARTN